MFINILSMTELDVTEMDTTTVWMMENTSGNANVTTDLMVTEDEGQLLDDFVLRALMIGKSILKYDVPIVFLLSSSFLLGLNNWMFVWCFFRSSRLHKPFNVLVLGMALADGMMTTFLAPIEITEIFLKLVVPGKMWCIIKFFFRTTYFSVSLISIFVVSLFRLLYVTVPTLRRPTLFSMTILVCIIYLLGACSSALTTTYTYKACLGFYRYYTTNKALIRYLAVFNFVIFLSTLLCYLILGLLLKFQCVSGSKLNSKNDILTLKISLVVTVWFAVCYLFPFIPTQIPLPPLNVILHYAAMFNTLVYLQSAVNPLIYTWNSVVYKEVIAETVPLVLSGLIHRLCCIRHTQVEPLPTASGNVETVEV